MRNSKGQFVKGSTPWHKGKNGVYSKKVRKAMSDGHKGKPTWNKGKKCPQFSGKNHPMWGKKHSLESRKRQSESRKEFYRNGGYPWNKGIRGDLMTYPVDWTETLRKSIRERDKYTCQICSKGQGDVAFSVHHIDYNKENTNPKNLITLCKSCHQKTNFNKDYWRKLFKTNL